MPSQCPVNYLTWHQAAALANALSAAEGLPACYECTGDGSAVSCSHQLSPYACTGYRMPTEAEWEHAARCETDTRYVGGNDADEVACYRENCPDTPLEVASLAPNRCGFYDMSGNMQELVNDIYDAEAYLNHTAVDPVGPAEGEFAVRRGGTWWDLIREVRVTSRQWYYFDFIDSHPGVRLARTAQD